MWQRYVLRSEIGSLQGPQGVPGGVMSWKGEYNPSTTYAANDAVIFEGRGFYALQSTQGNDPPSWPDTEDTYWSLFAEKGADGESGIKTIWADMPGNPFRLSDNSFKITDISNANEYDKVFSPGTIIAWEKSGGGWQVAKIQSASYSSNFVTFTILGNTLSSGFTDMKYCFHRPLEDVWIIPGNMPSAAVVDIGKFLPWAEDRYVFSGQVIYGTAPTTTDGAWDINDDGISLFTAKLPIAAGATEGTETQADSLSGTATVEGSAKSKITLDYDSGHATTPGADAYIFLWSMPVAWRYIP